jgi:hypothetical protein
LPGGASGAAKDRAFLLRVSGSADAVAAGRECRVDFKLALQVASPRGSGGGVTARTGYNSQARGSRRRGALPESCRRGGRARAEGVGRAEVVRVRVRRVQSGRGLRCGFN